MKVLLLGHNGYLGAHLLENIDVDILQERNVYNNGKTYDYIINCIGKPNLEYCEKNPIETNYSNCDVILDIKKIYPKSKIINFSSYYVYNDDGECTENSVVTKKYNYTRQKLKGESLIENGVSFRVGKLFGSSKNTQNKLTEHILSSKELHLDNVWFNPTSLSQIEQVVKFELHNNKLQGIFNLANSGNTTHYEYGIFINNLLNSNKIINKIEKIQRGFDNYGRFLMSLEKIKKYVKLNDWKCDMKDFLKINT
jgi:dTDP-4-dehydrorhamnose reductase